MLSLTSLVRTSYLTFLWISPFLWVNCTLSVVCSYTDRRSFPGRESNYAEVSLSLSSDHRLISLPGLSKIFPLSLHTHHLLMITAWKSRSLYWICIRYNYSIANVQKQYNPKKCTFINYGKCIDILVILVYYIYK